MNLKKTLIPFLSLMLVFGIGTSLLANGAPLKKPIKVLMVGGGSSHDFDKWYKGADVATLEKDGLAEVTYTDDPSTILQYLDQTDVLFLANNQPIPDEDTRKAIFAFADAGKGIVLAHPALWYNWNDWPEYNKTMVSGGSRGHNAYGNFNVDLTAKHPVTKGLPKSFSLDDELYYFKVDPAGPGVEILAQASNAETDPFPSIFIVKNPKAKIVGIALGHDAASHELEAYQTLIRNAVKWAAK
ncbi:Type 1 glutamine amidotransferase (GATase1) [Algoriphagus locisalis]|uniref:Type 1 glutamine amidotransferase (GATase1) n=1 Tax=Algoriphagus locisalis TaxID=305507 RepID=A0A1I7DCP1_9BACT|nr:ThuA domain-containing protein [Algoriphagus locisalis]SFU09366.1 Type 1 glutamine amidotransferase (GATase1) [Algoriphagus locisalis]